MIAMIGSSRFSASLLSRMSVRTVIASSYRVHLSPSDLKKQRQKHLKERVDVYFEWVKTKYDQVTHNSTIGKALGYSINQENTSGSSLMMEIYPWITIMPNKLSSHSLSAGRTSL